MTEIIPAGLTAEKLRKAAAILEANEVSEPFYILVGGRMVRRLHLRKLLWRLESGQPSRWESKRRRVAARRAARRSAP